MNGALNSIVDYTLPPDAPYLANLAALWEMDCELAQSIESEDDVYPIELARSGAPTLALISSESPDKRYLHSRYDPSDEGRRLLGDVKIHDHYLFAVHGLGLGYHLEALFEAASDESLFCIFEPDVKLIRTAMRERNLAALIESGRLLFFPRADKGELFRRLHAHMPLAISGIEPICHAPCIQLHSEFHQQCQLWLREFEEFARTSIRTLVINGRRTAENIARNLAWYVTTPGVDRLKDCHKGEPAIIISAGPSLRKNKHLLAQAREKAVLITVQTTLKPMLELGVEPDFVTSLDYHDICTRFFENLPSSLRTELVAEPKASDKIFERFPGRVDVIGNNYAESLLREMKLDKAELRAGATVAHLAYYLAEFMGCDPIIFVGQDLGFSDGLCYSPGTSYEDVWRPELSRFCTVEMKQWEQIVRDRHALRRVRDVEGRPTYTEERLFAYLQQFERDFAAAKARIIDATEGGVAKRGASPMKLADALEQYCGAAHINRTPIAAWTAGGSGLAQARQCIAKRRSEAEQIGELAAETLPLLREVEAHLEDQDRVNDCIARIDTLRARMNELGQTYDLITQLTQSTELSRFQADRQIAASQLHGIDRQRRQVGRDIANVQGLLAAIEPFVMLMDDVLDRLARMIDQPREVAA